MKVAVVGATGLVGTKMLQVLQERNFPLTELIPVASEKSIGKTVLFQVFRLDALKQILSNSGNLDLKSRQNSALVVSGVRPLSYSRG